MKKKILTAVVVGALACVGAIGLIGCGGSDNGGGAGGESLRFTTGGESGTYYAFGGVIAQHATNNADLNVIVSSSDGSKANVVAIQDGDAEIGFCQADVAAYAFSGTNVFEEEGAVDSFSTVCALYMEQVQIVTCDPSIKSVDDLRGKTVSIGAANSGVYFNAIDILGAYGMTTDDITPVYQSFGDSTESLKDGKIDAAFIVAGAPTTSITDLSASKTAYLVSLDQAHVDALCAASDYYQPATIAADSKAGADYGLTEDVQTVAIASIIIAADTVSEDAIYAFVADLFGSLEDEAQVSAHDKYNEVSIEAGAAYTSVPYHPGAAKFFAENGITVATK